MKENKFYLTTTLPYTNAPLHIGHAFEFVRADIIARYKRLQGFDVFFNTGSDEHGQKIWQKALLENKTPQEYVDGHVESFKKQVRALNISFDNFIRTTDENHIKAAQDFWKVCLDNGDIYKKNYKAKYCVGCESEKTDSELVNGECPDHPGQKIEEREEENYFFRWSKYQEKLLELYEKEDFIIPDFRRNEIREFVRRGLNDFSISRLKEKMPWGVPVPEDDKHVMYVWFDALVNYISAIGWPENKEMFDKYWPVVQFCGKDNNKPQSAMWQAMLMSAGLEPSKQIVIHGHILSNGQKMSKSIGNVANPLDIIDEYGADALRYYLSREISSSEDGDYTAERFKEVYNANLANGIGNLTSRILKMTTTNGVAGNIVNEKDFINSDENSEYRKSLDTYKFDLAMNFIWQKIGELDSYIQKEEPFKKIKENEEDAKKDLQFLIDELYKIAVLLKPFMPETSSKIKEAIEQNKMPDSLFVRK